MTVGEAPKFRYEASKPSKDKVAAHASVVESIGNHNEGRNAPVIDLGDYRRENVTNLHHHPDGRQFFDLGLRLLLSYQHELAAAHFLACLQVCPDCALAHSLVAICHSPNYNFKGDAYYESTDHPEEAHMEDSDCIFPSQQVADRHSKLAVEKVDELKKLHRTGGNGGVGGGSKKRGNKKRGKGSNNSNNNSQKHKVQPNSASSSTEDATSTSCASAEQSLEGSLSSSSTQPSPALPRNLICDVEVQIVQAVRTLTCSPGIDSGLSEELVGRPYADAMRKCYQQNQNDPEVAYFFAEALMVLNAWQLYEYPTGRPLSKDVVETRLVLETALEQHNHHAGLCHMYVHLSEMSSDPAKALKYCAPLRNAFPHAGHLIHMPTHIDVLVGDYESCVRSNYAAILADDRCMESSPHTAGPISFYFGYIVHNYHMLCYGCILGGMEGMAMKMAEKLNHILNECLFREHPNLADYLESYSALEVHTMIRFGRWKDILEVLEDPKDKHLMLFRAATIKFARGLAYANLGEIEKAKKEADRYDTLWKDPLTKSRILHNNQVSDLLAVDAPMLRGEIAFFEGRYDDAFRLLRKAVDLQDTLNFDEPWGKMQPIRHTLGGLLMERGHLVEAEEVFRADLELRPKNPWGLKGLVQCLERMIQSGLLANAGSRSSNEDDGNIENQDVIHAKPRTVEWIEMQELPDLRRQLQAQRKSEWADFEIRAACACCQTDAML